MRIALLSDIHGNLPALEAVVRDARRSGVDRIVNLGDSLSGAILPRETCSFLMEQPWPQLAGNHERQLLHFDEEHGSESDRYALRTLDANALRWLAGLPQTLRLSPDVLLCHGTPRSDCENLLESIDERGIRIATRAEVDARLSGCDPQLGLIACGHTHVPRAARASCGTLIVNPGSVGLPAFESERPHPYAVENGAPDARYAVVEQHGRSWHVELRSVPYDHELASRLALAHGRPDWAYALSTGYARG